VDLDPTRVSGSDVSSAAGAGQERGGEGGEAAPHAADLANGDGTVTARLGPMPPQSNPRALHVRSPLIVI
jgi:hypothetical protein